MEKLGKKIISERILLGLDQVELSRKSGISCPTLSKWECNGILNAKVSNVLKITSVLNCKIEDLI